MYSVGSIKEICSQPWATYRFECVFPDIRCIATLEVLFTYWTIISTT